SAKRLSRVMSGPPRRTAVLRKQRSISFLRRHWKMEFPSTGSRWRPRTLDS
ncbi:uncharacterized protein METZ01_LOCUS412508, partial [marine metagenome]